jgi:hypothetical protein
MNGLHDYLFWDRKRIEPDIEYRGDDVILYIPRLDDWYEVTLSAEDEDLVILPWRILFSSNGLPYAYVGTTVKARKACQIKYLCTVSF